MVEEAMNESLPCPLFLAQTPLTSIDQMAWCMGEKRPAPPEVIRGRGRIVSQLGVAPYLSAHEAPRIGEVVPRPANPVTTRVHRSRISAQVIPGTTIH